jgi:hypothetical protein
MSVTAMPLRKALTTNSTATAFTAKIPVATEPSGDGVFDLTSASVAVGSPTKVPSYIEVIPYAVDGNNDTLDMRLWGWSRVNVEALWIPRPLAEMSVVIGNISGAAIAANTFMADTITLDLGAADGAFTSIISPAGDVTASILIHTRGCRYIEFDFDLAGAQEAVSMNAMWRPVD